MKSLPQPVLPASFMRNAHAVLTRLDHLEDVGRWALATPGVRMARIVKREALRRAPLLLPADQLRGLIFGPDGKPMRSTT